MSSYGDQSLLELVGGGTGTRRLSSHSVSVEYDGMQREVSKGTWNAYKQTESFWSILNVISDNKIEKLEWNFVLKTAGDGKPILSEDESDFLFMYMDKNNSGDITKPELRILLNLVVSSNKWEEHYTPTTAEMIKSTYEYALKDKMKTPIDFTLQTAVIATKNKLTKFGRQLDTAKVYTEDLNKAITGEKATLFGNPQEMFDDQLKEHASTIEQYASGPLQTQYDEVKKLLQTAKDEYNLVNSRIQQFVEQDDELEYMRARDAKCCKIFGCVCPCAF